MILRNSFPINHMPPRRRPDKTLIFADFSDFRPNQTPAEVFRKGAFGGTYWRPIHSSVTKRDYANKWKKYSFLAKIPADKLSCPDYDASKNMFGVKAGSSLEAWETSGWITKHDPYGWMQWYCEFYAGRRCEDDERQVGRWRRFAGPTGRFFLRVTNGCTRENKRYNDASVSPVSRQGLLHWGVVVTNANTFE